MDPNGVYLFLIGPALWFSATFCAAGFLARLCFLYGMSLGQDKVFYNHQSFYWGSRSIAHWLVPWGSVSYRTQPVFTFFLFSFHLTLLATPIFCSAHNELLEKAFGFSLWSLPDTVTDAMTVILLVSGIFLLVRRLVRPEVRALTGVWDYVLLALTVLPFASGFAAYHQASPYGLWTIVHVASGELLLVLLPLTKLGHVVLFFFTRAFIGFEMGTRRGTRTW
ncbi:MAG: nitrate reductase [Thermodesulfobacteriota bacterium]